MSDLTNEIDVDWLTSLDTSDVDFQQLPEETLVTLSRGTEPNFATLAIFELHRRGSSLAAPTAQNLVEYDQTDPYLKAAALSVLFDTDPISGISYMRAHMTDAHPFVLNQVIEIMLREETSFRVGAGTDLVDLVRERLKTLPDQELMRQDTRELFEELYPKRPL